jgi:hypothetical protein
MEVLCIFTPQLKSVVFGDNFDIRLNITFGISISNAHLVALRIPVYGTFRRNIYERGGGDALVNLDLSGEVAILCVKLHRLNNALS